MDEGVYGLGVGAYAEFLCPIRALEGQAPAFGQNIVGGHRGLFHIGPPRPDKFVTQRVSSRSRSLRNRRQTRTISRKSSLFVRRSCRRQ
jgi:hypothetical protein